MRHLIVRAFPVLSGKEDGLKRFIAGLQQRSEQTSQFYQRYGITRESWHIQRTAPGSVLIAVTQFDAPPGDDVVKAYAESQSPFEAWFKGEVEDFSGINLDFQPLGPASKCIFDWPPVAA